MINCYRRTADGGAYPLDIPQGQIGQGLNGICLTAVASKLGLLTSTFKRQAHCFMQRQLGYMYNHKCADNAEHGDSSCNTDDSEGFSYIVGYVVVIHRVVFSNRKMSCFRTLSTWFLPPASACTMYNCTVVAK